MQTMMESNVDLAAIRSHVSEALNQLGAQLVSRLGEAGGQDQNSTLSDPVTQRLQDRIGALGQIAAGLAVIDEDCLPSEGAGYGSTVVVEHLESGDVEQYTLMVGTLVDLDAGQVSLASPIGRALLGRMPGDQVTVATPYKPLRLRVVGVTTLLQWLEADDSAAAA